MIMGWVRVRVMVKVFQREVVCFRGFLKFLFSCNGFYCVLQLSRRFEYLPLWIWLWLGLGIGLGLVYSMGSSMF